LNRFIWRSRRLVGWCEGTVNLALIATRSHIFQSVSKGASASINIENDF
jgi:hypothetical protein